jgi:hypothetical protein
MVFVVSPVPTTMFVTIAAVNEYLMAEKMDGFSLISKK